MTDQRLMLITGDRKGIGRYLVGYYLKKNYRIIGCSRKQVDFEHENFLAYFFAFSSERLPTISSSAYGDFIIAGIVEFFAIREQPIIPNLIFVVNYLIGNY